MPTSNKQSAWQGSVATMLIPAIVFIASAGALFLQVSDLKVMMKETSTNIQSMSQRLTAVETKVQFMYDERKRE
ncbi:MAG TPA: hypothetical protein EYN51_06385 [Flavobacteriales bacterium]|nr:hypothetical protein [Flavobacteriales bacterium]